jgi:hypothetical protein
MLTLRKLKRGQESLPECDDKAGNVVVGVEGSDEGLYVHLGVDLLHPVLASTGHRQFTAEPETQRARKVTAFCTR